jgi:imidazolonepropionase-like amidohydrolase
MSTTRTLGALLLAASFGSAALNAQAEYPVLAVRNGTVHTLAGAPIEGGTVVIEQGHITAVGSDVTVPAGARVIDATGLHVYPGIFDALSRLGLTEVGAVDVTVDVNELGDFNPHLLAMTAVHPASEHIPVARANGITHTVSMPGAPDGGIGGQGSLIHTDGWTVEEMVIEPSVGLVLSWPSLQSRRFGFGGGAAAGRSFGDLKEQYDKKVATIDAWLDSAAHYADAVSAGTVPERDLRLEALARVVSGELPLLVAANSERQITDAVAFADRHGVRIVITGGREAWKVADRLAEKGVPVILGPTQSLPGGEDEGYDQVYAAPGQLFAAGVKIGFATFNASSSRNLPFEAANAVAYGLPKGEALRAITINCAEMLGVADRLGTIESGKIANLIVTDGDPMEYQTQILHVIVDGRAADMHNKHLDLYERYRARPRR